ncbi:PAB-dependent poly(A)-specific ribonuclease subunit PAN2 [Beauveria bassiana D1-5]|uniref:PAN2-PAN3 deadenylation complex catalytic subunit PAN2 n=1 Tax=Beauveria bassiana D1-5 TaxID=1245745 RepID=A0A0A2VJ86_BEABA|nr:PAB-dependent poly(A)-specific ribonuclease subunit PAN2 [Beauveria bassiana D1-5]
MDVLTLQKWAYIDAVPSYNATAYGLLHHYSGISAADIDSHLLRIRKLAWDVSRQPFIGRWRFLQLAEPLDPYYQQVLFRLTLPKSKDCILDIGCGFGQALRQLRADGVAGSKLFGADIESRFISLGYDLFRDKDTLGATFLSGDLLDPDDERLDMLAGRFTIVHADSFFHLMSWTEQLYAAKRLIVWLRKDTNNGFIYGKHAGTIHPAEVALAGSRPYLHNRQSFQRLWDEAGEMTNTKWRVEVERSVQSADEKILTTFKGRVTSFFGSELQRYTSFKAHLSSEGPVRQILVNDKGVIALGSSDVHMSMRRGATIWHIKHEAMRDLRCMSFTSKGTAEIIVAGMQDTMLVIDLNKGEVVKQVPTEYQYSMMKRGRYICAATQTGLCNLLDPVTFAVIKSWNAHSALISDMDAQHDFIVTCGYSLRQGQNYMLDPFLNVFDIKNMSSMPPIPFPAGAAYVRMHPRMLTTSIVVSQSGQMHVVDLMNPNTSNVRQANVMTYLNMFEIAPSGEGMVLTDAECLIHLWGSRTKLHFVDLAKPIEFAATEERLAPIDWSPEVPLNTVGLPYYRDVLASAWPDLVCDVGAPPPKVDPQAFSTLKATTFALYGRNTRNLRRNQFEDTRNLTKSVNAGLRTPKFLSEKARESAKSDSVGDDRADELNNPLAEAEIESKKSEVPAMYGNVEIKYSKFGVDDFDFGFYNKTKYSGLEIHISNSYANSLLQMMHFIPVIRNLALRHAATSCLSEICILCELGYLFDMLQKAEGSICQATNLLKTLSNQPQAGALGLLEEDPRGSSLNMMLQGLTRFLLDKIVQDYRLIEGTSAPMEQVLSTSATSSINCISCRSEYTRPGSTLVNDLLYPAPKTQTNVSKMPKVTFSQVLKNSVERETTSKGWCGKCSKYKNIATKKTIHSVPAVLILNTAINSPEHRMLWSTPGWLPEEIGIIVDQGQFFCYEGEDLKLHLQRGMHNITVYSLIGMAINIENGQTQKPHLVSMINVAHAEVEAPGKSQWHLFNDFLVRSVSTEEALTFNPSWKVPSVIAFQVKDANNKLDSTWRDQLDTSVLYQDVNPHPPESKTYKVLKHPEDHPGPDTIIALDTEFVAVRQPEIEMNSDGERETIRPIVYALARASVVRGQGEDEGLPFIDDYITIKEPIVDYLTSYSGITQSDLDPRISQHSLLPLKMVYKKLWVLLNLGCKFLGHGLKQDFRVINIHVPKSQIIDTIDLFYLKTRLRKLSLAFLAWYLLKEDIQMETHDSIEDSRTALKLYRKYLEFEDAGILEPMLQDIYRAGRDVNFKPPRKDGQDVQRIDTPPLPVDGNGGPSTPVTKAATLATPGFGGAGASWTPGKGSPLR